MKTQRHAFTIIELLISVVVFAILMAIVYPRCREYVATPKFARACAAAKNIKALQPLVGQGFYEGGVEVVSAEEVVSGDGEFSIGERFCCRFPFGLVEFGTEWDKITYVREWRSQEQMKALLSEGARQGERITVWHPVEGEIVATYDASDKGWSFYQKPPPAPKKAEAEPVKEAK